MRMRLAALLMLLLPAQAWAYWIRECWTTENWDVRTEMVADLYPGPEDTVKQLFGFSHVDAHMIVYKGALYFQGNDGQSGAELWRVSGSGAPTRVADLVPGSGGSAPHAFAILGGDLYFAATTPETGEELFRTDGTMIQLAAETVSGPSGAEISMLTPYKNALYFARGDAPLGNEVWRYANGATAPVDAINDLDGAVDDWATRGTTFAVFKDRLYFVLDVHDPNYELWAYNGAGVQKIKVLEADGQLTGRSFELGVDPVREFLYFGVVVPKSDKKNELQQRDELWRYDGKTLPVRIRIFDEWPGAWSYSQPTDFVMFQGRMHFVAGGQMFRITDNDVEALPSGPTGLPDGPDHLTVFEAFDQLYFSAGYSDPAIRREPHFYDGTSASLIKDIMPAGAESGSSFPSRAADLGGTLYFFAEDAQHGRELWRIVGRGMPVLECDIVVAPIWEDERLWVMEQPEVIVATWRVTADGRPERLSRKTVAVKRDEAFRVSVLKPETKGRKGTGPFALMSVVYNRENGEVLDQGFDVVGAATPAVREKLARAAAKLLKDELDRAPKPQQPARKAGARKME